MCVQVTLAQFKCSNSEILAGVRGNYFFYIKLFNLFSIIEISLYFDLFPGVLKLENRCGLHITGRLWVYFNE